MINTHDRFIKKKQTLSTHAPLTRLMELRRRERRINYERQQSDCQRGNKVSVNT